MSTASGPILVFARAPRAGRCKTRLIPRLGPRGAARLHGALVRQTLAAATATGRPVQLWTEPDSRHGLFIRCRQTYGVSLHRQPRGDLGRRMAAALDAALAGGAAAAVLVGTDCLLLDPPALEQAFGALASTAVTLRPAEDGGFVLIGSRQPLGRRLQGVRWSSGRELAQTLRRLRRGALTEALLPPAWDLDDGRDYARARRLRLLPDR